MSKNIKFRLLFVKPYLIIVLIGIYILLSSCTNFFKPVSSKDVPVNAQERARKNINEGKGLSIGNTLKGMKNTNYEFSTSNPLWRASLEILDFLPLTTVDYSGGIIITDWYSDGNSNNESIKITVRFLGNQIQTNNLKIIVHQKKCLSLDKCSITEVNSKIKEELVKSIFAKAAVFEKEQKKK